MSDITRKIIRYGTIVVGVLLLVLCIWRFFGELTKYKDNMAKADLQVAELQKQILAENAKIEALEADKQNVQVGIYDMRDAGQAVASAQQSLFRKNLSVITAVNQDDALAEYNSLAMDFNRYFADDIVDSPLWLDVNNAYSSKVQWRCLTLYDFGQTQYPCLWSCSDSAGVVYAYATANYDVNTKLFSDVRVYVTEDGRSISLSGGDFR